MGLSARCLFALALSAGLLAAESGAPETGRQLRVRVYDYTDISPNLLSRARRQATEVLERAGIQVTWEQCRTSDNEDNKDTSCTQATGPHVIQLRIHSREMVKTVSKRSIEFGYALPLTEGLGVVAGVFLERTTEMAAALGLDTHVVLGHTMAHEIGHLLLGSNSHAKRGIMKPTWREPEIHLAKTAALGFTDAQAKQMQAQIAERLFALQGTADQAAHSLADSRCRVDSTARIGADYLDECRPQPIDEAWKETVLRSLPLEGEVRRLDALQRQKLEAVTEVLRALARDTVYDLKIIDVPQAFAGLHGKAVLLISLPALQLLGVEELQAITAHEAGHEYLWEEYEVAHAQKNEPRLRELEMACDAIATLTLLRLHLPPGGLISALEKLFRFNRRRFGMALNENSYPPLRDRGEAIRRLAALPGRVASESKSLPEIVVRVYNYAGVAVGVLNAAERQATYILLQAGVRTRWLTCTVRAGVAEDPRCNDHEASEALSLLLCPENMVPKQGLPPRIFGFSLMPEAGRPATSARLYIHRLEELAGPHLRKGPLLGSMMAHEIGHLLLGTNSHSRKGIMSIPWNGDTLKKADLGQLWFTPKEAAAIRAETLRRIGRAARR